MREEKWRLDTEMQEGHRKSKEKEPCALPREEVTNWPVCKSKAPGDSSATMVPVPPLGLQDSGGTKDDICQRAL